MIENPVINRVAFEGNKKVKDEQLSAEIQSKPRGTLSRPMVQSDAQRIVEIYRHSGRYDVTVTPEMIDQPNNRVDLIFTIQEGGKTSVKSIDFVGNSYYSSYRLKDIIKTHESNLLSFLGGNDVYDPDRVEADRDLIRRFYLKHGFADVQVVAALTEYDPDRKGFLVTFKIEEGQQYRVGSVDFQSSIADLDVGKRCAASRASASARSIMSRRWRNRSRRCRSRRRAAATPSRWCVRAGTAISRPTPFRWCSRSRRGRAPISSASTSAATPAPVTM